MSDLREMARRLGGVVVGQQILAPGPGHDPRDRSLSLKFSAGSRDGFLAHSFAGDDWRDCRDFVRARFGMSDGNVDLKRRQRSETPPSADRTALARQLWRASVEGRDTLAENYLASRGLALSAEPAHVIRFHPACPWREGDRLIRVPAMIAAMGSIDGDAIVAVRRTRLDADGRKVDRRMLGDAAIAAIKLDADADVSTGLHIGEGVETCIAARQFGLTPTWALGSSGAIPRFPVLAGIECLTILCERDAASERATQACAERWHAAGREVLINRSRFGSDLNDALARWAA